MASPRREASIRLRTITSTRTPGRIPGPLQFGNAPRVDGTVRGFPNYSEDINIFKEFKLGDEKKFRFEMDFGNLFNRTLFCDPNTNWSSPAFGTVNTQCNQPRSIQFAFRFDF